MPTAAGIAIQENAAPDVLRDILCTLDRIVPRDGAYRYAEGNSPAHVKSAIVGSSATLVVEGSAPVLGTWQSVFFCEFDGPRRRSFWVQVVPA